METTARVILLIAAVATAFVVWWLWETWRMDNYVKRLRSRFHWREMENDD